MPNSIAGGEVLRGIEKLTSLFRQSEGANGFDRRTTKEKFGWYYLDGRKLFRISSRIHPQGDLPKWKIKALQEYLKLNRGQFADLCQCKLSGPNYHELIRSKHESGEL